MDAGGMRWRPLTALAAGLAVAAGLAGCTTNQDGLRSGPGNSDRASAVAAPRTWTAVQTPFPAGGTTYWLANVSCPRPAYCVADGDYTTRSGQGGMVLTGSGDSWVATAVPVPPNTAPTLAGISCWSESSCVIAGEYYVRPRQLEGLLLTRSGGSWTAAQVKLPANAAVNPVVTLGGVSCPSDAMCVAVGRYQDKSGHAYGLVLTRSGATWTPAQAPLPANAAAVQYNVGLIGVSCPTTSACVAVGYYTDESGTSEPLLLTWVGGAWQAMQAPLPPGGVAGWGMFSLGGISCPSVTSCVATGTYESRSGVGLGLLLTLSGSSWTAARAPVPPRDDSKRTTGVSGVSCSSASSCVAVGSYFATSPSLNALLLIRSGGSWRPVQVPLPGDAGRGFDASLSAVSCPGPATCTAVGSYTRKTGSLNGGLILISS